MKLEESKHRLNLTEVEVVRYDSCISVSVLWIWIHKTRVNIGIDEYRISNEDDLARCQLVIS